MDEKKYKDLINKACEKFRNIPKEKIEATAKRMFQKEYDSRDDKDFLIVHRKNTFVPPHIISKKPDQKNILMITNSVYIFLTLIYGLVIKKSVKV